MSLYNQLFHFDPLAKPLLATLELNPLFVPRFRDCFLMEGKIVVYTRTGGGNRAMNEQPWVHQGELLGTITAPASWTEICSAHPDFLGTEDDEFDLTYAFFFFRYPEKWKDKLEQLAQDHTRPRPSVRWKQLYADMEKPGYEPPEAMRKMFEDINQAFNKDE